MLDADIVEVSETEALAVKNKVSAESLQAVLIGGDLSRLTKEQELEYYSAVCKTVGLNPLTKPFDYIILQGQKKLYANKNCAEQLRKVYKISIDELVTQEVGGVFVVTAKVSDMFGRKDSATGAVNMSNLKGDNLANAIMKAETKAKRRATLSICGLGMLDETEIETINNAKTQKAEIGYATTPKKQVSSAKKTIDEFRTILIENGISNKDFFKFAKFANISTPDDTKKLLSDKEQLLNTIKDFKEKSKGE